MEKRIDWEEWYSVLVDYYSKFGNINVPTKYVTDSGLKLGIWLHTQREAYCGNTNRKISQERIELLNKLGMIWRVTTNWDKYYKSLEAYYNENGDTDVPYKYVTDDKLELGKWVATQRNIYNHKCKGTLTDKQIELLENLEIKWDYRTEKWDTYYYALEDYYKKNNHIDVPGNYVTDTGLKLGKWVATQRRAYNSDLSTNKLSCDQILILNDLNFDWNTRATKFLNMRIVKENKNRYYVVLNDRLNHVLDDISYEVSNEITKDNQEELCKQMVKRLWR